MAITPSGPSAERQKLCALVVSAEPRPVPELIRAFEARGHVALVCPRGGWSCLGSGGQGCPVEDNIVDVACTWRSEVHPAPTTSELGLACAARKSAPIVVAGRTTSDPFEHVPRVTVELPVDDPAELVRVVWASEALSSGRVAAAVCRPPSAGETVTLAVRAAAVDPPEGAPAWFLLTAGFDRLVLAEAAVLCGSLLRAEPGNRVMQAGLEIIQTAILRLFDSRDVIDLRPLPHTPSRPTPLRVLLVEDDAAYARLVGEVLALGVGNIELEHVDTLTAALARAGHDDRTVIVADLNLPDSSGVDTVRMLHGAAPDVPIVVLSAQLDDDVRLEAVRAGADDYFDKGHFELGQLARVVQLAAARRHREIGEGAGGSGVAHDN